MIRWFFGKSFLTDLLILLFIERVLPPYFTTDNAACFGEGVFLRVAVLGTLWWQVLKNNLFLRLEEVVVYGVIMLILLVLVIEANMAIRVLRLIIVVVVHLLEMLVW